MDSQACSSSDPIGSDHRIVCAKIRLSMQPKKNTNGSRLHCDIVSTNPCRASQIENQIFTEWDILERNQSSTYQDFVDIWNKVGSTILPPRKPVKIRVQGTAEINAARDAVLNAQAEMIHNKSYIM